MLIDFLRRVAKRRSKTIPDGNHENALADMVRDYRPPAAPMPPEPEPMTEEQLVYTIRQNMLATPRPNWVPPIPPDAPAPTDENWMQDDPGRHNPIRLCVGISAYGYKVTEPHYVRHFMPHFLQWTKNAAGKNMGNVCGACQQASNEFRDANPHLSPNYKPPAPTPPPPTALDPNAPYFPIHNRLGQNNIPRVKVDPPLHCKGTSTSFRDKPLLVTDEHDVTYATLSERGKLATGKVAVCQDCNNVRAVVRRRIKEGKPEEALKVCHGLVIQGRIIMPNHFVTIVPGTVGARDWRGGNICPMCLDLQTDINNVGVDAWMKANDWPEIQTQPKLAI